MNDLYKYLDDLTVADLKYVQQPQITASAQVEYTLMTLMSRGYLDLVKTILEDEINTPVVQKVVSSGKLLGYAVSRDNQKMTKYLLEEYPTKSHLRVEDDYLFNMAAAYGGTKLLKYLIEDCPQKDEFFQGHDPVSHGSKASFGKPESLKYLLNSAVSKHFCFNSRFNSILRNVVRLQPAENVEAIICHQNSDVDAFIQDGLKGVQSKHRLLVSSSLVTACLSEEDRKVKRTQAFHSTFMTAALDSDSTLYKSSALGLVKEMSLHQLETVLNCFANKTREKNYTAPSRRL